MNKLNCFHCHTRFHYYHTQFFWDEQLQKYLKKPKFIKETIYRDEEGLPICKTCLLERIADDWEDEEVVLRHVESFQNSYQKYMASLYHILCPNCRATIAIANESPDFEDYCFDCHKYFIIRNKKPVAFFETEEDFYKHEEEIDKR